MYDPDDETRRVGRGPLNVLTGVLFEHGRKYAGQNNAKGEAVKQLEAIRLDLGISLELDDVEDIQDDSDEAKTLLAEFLKMLP